MRNAVLSLVILVATLQTTESLKTCQNKDGVKSVPCNHGDCSSDGSCLCQPCWRGAFCDIFVNTYEPTFDQFEQDIVTDIDGKWIQQVQATDQDFETTCSSQLPCDCANISYSILNGNLESTFMIDPDTGIISLVNGARRSKDTRYHLEIAARNPNKEYGDVSRETSSVTALHILLPGKKENNENQPEHHLSRRKRFAPANPIPANTTFELKQVGPATTHVEKGMALAFELYLHFAVGTTDLLVEIFTPVNQTEVFTLCNPAIDHVGSNIEFDKKPPTIDKSESTGVNNRAVFELGNVTNTGTATSNYNDSLIKIVFIVIMIDSATDLSVNGKSFWLSAGVEYNNKDDIWIGQKSFVARQVTNFNATPASFTLTGPSEVSVDASALFKLKLNLPILANEIKIDVFPPLNVSSVMTVCNIRVTGYGRNFECLNTSSIASSLTESEIDSGYSRGHLDMGYITNSMVRSNAHDSNEDYFDVEFTLNTFNDTSLIGKTVYVGAAVMMGPDYIWTSRKPIQIKAIQPFTIAQTIQSEIKGGKLTVRANEPAITFLHLFIQNEGVSSIAIKLNLPSNSMSSFEICSLSTVSTGINIPCIKQKQTFYHIAESEAILNLGTVEAFTTGNNTYNEIIIQLVVKPRETIAKGTYAINVEVTSESTTTNTTQLTYNVSVFNDSTTANDTYKPTSTISVQNDRQTIFQGESTKVSVNITFPEATTIPVLEIESFAVEANGKYLFSLCKAEIAWVGRNIQCLNLTRTQELMEFVPKPESVDFDYKVKVPLQNICLTDVFTEPYDNTITIDITYRLEAAIPNNKTWITAGLTLNTKLWVGQVAMQEKTGIADVILNGPQRVDIIDVKQLTSLPISYIQGYNINIKIPPLTAAKVVVKVSSDSSALSVCSVRLVAKGSNIGCLRNETTEVQEMNSILKKSIQLDFGPITNLGVHGIHQSTFFDKSSVLLQALVTFQAASSGTLTLSVTLGSQTPIDTTFPLTATSNASVNYTNVVKNVVNFVAPIANRTSTNVNKGEAKRVVIQFYVTPETFQSMKFQTRVNNIGMVEICDYNIIHSGTNIPCLDKKLITGKNISKEEWMIEANICSWPIDEEDPESNKVQVEAIVKVPKNSAISLNDVINVTTDIYINDSLVETTQLALTVVDAFTEDFLDWMTNDNTTNLISAAGTPVTSAEIGEVFDLNINLSIPVNSSSLVKFNVSVPVTETAHLTIRDIKYNGSDQDIACIDGAEVNFASTKNTSQIDKGEMDFGIVTNTGVTRRILQQKELYFSTIHVILTLQMADAKENTDQSDKSIMMELRVGSFIGTLDHIVKVNRNANNAPKLYFEAGFNDTGRPLLTRNVVYSIRCIEAACKNIGETSRSIAERLNKHLRQYDDKKKSFDKYGSASS
uniref:Cadherin domain-containing protein n=1 Tax=Octopus bimaculoides TaxID=37653 RepID=A0A0L8HLM0_OCTBM